MVRESPALGEFSLHYGGAKQSAQGTGVLELRSPATRQLLASVPEASDADVSAAADAAAAAAPQWAATDSGERARLLRALAELMRSRMGELSDMESAVTGRPIREMRAQMSRIPEWLEYFAGIILGVEGESNRVKGGFLTYSSLEPYGVCALLTPWNHPILILVKKMAAALAAGNVCLIKPSELAPVSPLILAEWCTEAGLPPGTVNVVTGGAEVGRAVCSNANVRRIDLTGGTETGRRVAAAAAERLIPCTLELGGKAPIIIAEDANVEEAVAGSIFAAFVAAGQTCVSGTRFIVAQKSYKEFIERIAKRAEALRVGDPADTMTDMGPVISAQAQARCIDHISAAKVAGARLIAGGDKPLELPAALRQGFYVKPTVFADVNSQMRLFREEVFGPVLAAMTVSGLDEALSLANASCYALSSSVFTSDVGSALTYIREIEAGVAHVNIHTGYKTPELPFGGWKDSGYGVPENARTALEFFVNRKAVYMRS